MVSQLDTDQGGTDRFFVRKYLGPSVGWQYVPQQSFLPVLVPGTTTLLLGTTMVSVSYNGDGVIIVLPSLLLPPAGPTTLPMPFARIPVTIYDAGGYAYTHPIKIQPAAGDTIMGLSEIEIGSNYGGWALMPHPEGRKWVTISG